MEWAEVTKKRQKVTILCQKAEFSAYTLFNIRLQKDSNRNSVGVFPNWRLQKLEKYCSEENP